MIKDHTAEYVKAMNQMLDKAALTHIGKNTSDIDEARSIISYFYQHFESHSPLKYDLLKSKERLFLIINSIIVSSAYYGKWDDPEEVKNCQERHRKAFNLAFPFCVPLTPEEGREQVEKLKTLKKEADAILKHQSSKERSYSIISLAVDMIEMQLTDSSSIRELISAFKNLGGKGNKIKNVKWGAERVEPLTPEDILVLKKLTDILPEIFSHKFLSRIILENEYMSQVYRQLSQGVPFEEATTSVLSGISGDKDIYDYLRNIPRLIKQHSKSCYQITEETRDNQLALFQLEVVEKYCSNKEPYLFIFDEPGTRKTATSIIALIERLKKDGYAKANIIAIVPSHLIQTWVDEIKDRMKKGAVSSRVIQKDCMEGKQITKDKDSAPFHIDIVGHTVLSHCRKIPTNYDAVIIDEDHNLKRNGMSEDKPHSRRSGRILKYINVEAKIKYRVMLTGTPVVNNCSEIANMINDFSGHEYFPVEQMRSLQSELNMARWIHLNSSGIVLRRLKADILDLPVVQYHQEEVVVDSSTYRRLLLSVETEKGDTFSLADTARLEALYPACIDATNNIIKRHAKSSGVVSSYYTSNPHGKDKDGILLHYYRKSKAPHKIYIAGDMVIDIHGKVYTTDILNNALIAREQYKNSEDPCVAYVSTKTCREGINEFTKADYAINVILPFEPASYIQFNSRLDRDGRDKNVSPHIYNIIVKYMDKDGRQYIRNGKELVSFSDRALANIKRKSLLLSVACDGVKRSDSGEIEPWEYDFEKPFKSVLDVSRDAKNKSVRITKMTPEYAFHKVMNIIEHMPQSFGNVMQQIEQYDNTVKHYYADKKTFHDRMGEMKTARHADELVVSKLNKYFKKKVFIAHVGCGTSQVYKAIKNKAEKVFRIDLYCEKKGIINCDMSETHEVCKDLDYLTATNVMHWQTTRGEISPCSIKAAQIEISSTMLSFSEAMKLEGVCLLVCPIQYEYPFAKNKKFLDTCGFELIETKVYKSVRYYTLRKVKEHKSSKIMSKMLLPMKKVTIKTVGRKTKSEKTKSDCMELEISY